MHELEHMRRYALLDALEAPPQGEVERLRFYSEQDIDNTTWNNLKRAYDHYQQIGDDSKYPFVIENKTDRFFVIG